MTGLIRGTFPFGRSERRMSMSILPTLAALASVVPRRAVLAGGLAGLLPAAAVADSRGGFVLAPPERNGLQAKWCV